MIKEAERELTEARHQLNLWEEKLGGRGFDLEEHQALESALGDAAEAVSEARKNLAVLRSRGEEQKQKLEQKKELEADLKLLDQRRSNLEVLLKLFKGRGFVRHISTLYLKELVDRANVRFETLTRRALRLELSDKNDFLIRDFLNDGKTRSVKTLSGGQTFQAAFSLSLALADSIGLNRVLYGLYLDGRSVDRSEQVVSGIGQLYPQAIVRTWQEVNSAFYSALMLEKVLMYLFLFFMFIILGVNMKNASSRLLHVKQRELAILRAVGARKKLAARVFLGQTFMVTLLGEAIGILGGVLVGTHISGVFSLINTFQYFFTRRDNLLLSYPFSTQVRPVEIVVIAISVLFLSLVFTYLGCRRLLRREPMEMLYHD